MLEGMLLHDKTKGNYGCAGEIMQKWECILRMMVFRDILEIIANSLGQTHANNFVFSGVQGI
jgi:hypothetical protein